MATSGEIGVAGLGAMGFGMAISLLRSGYNVTGYDVDSNALDKLKDEGGNTPDTVPELAKTSRCFLCMVATSDQARSLLFEPSIGAIEHLPKSAIIILGITARPDVVSSFQDQINSSGRGDIKVIDCPVSGGEARARAGTLSLICSGDDDCIAQVKPVLQALGSQIHAVPGGLGAASRVKFVHQILVGVNISAAIEVFALAQEAQLDSKAVFSGVMTGDAASWLFDQRISHILDPTSVPASSLSIIVKDLSAILANARSHGIPLPMALVAEQLFKLTYVAKQDHTDDTLLFDIYRPRDTSDVIGKIDTRLQMGHQDIVSILAGIHAAASIEVLAFVQKLGVNVQLFADIVETAAGSNKMFLKLVKNVVTLEKDGWSAMTELESMKTNLVQAMEKLQAHAFPLPIASTAAQVLSLVGKINCT